MPCVFTSQNHNRTNALLNIHNQTTPVHQLYTNREPRKIVAGKNFSTLVTKGYS